MSIESVKSGTDLAQSGPEKIRFKSKSKRAKDHLDYWKAKLQKRTFEWSGETKEVGTWQIRIAYLGRREWFNLHTANRTEGANKAREIYFAIVSQGWEATLDKYKPVMVAKSNDVTTVGKFLSEVKATSALRPVTFEIYASKFRRVVGGVFNVQAAREKFDYVNGGSKKWLERIDRVRLHKLTPQRIQRWLVQYLQSTSDCPLKHKRACVTIHSLIRNSKSLFAPKILKFLNVKLPPLLPFQGVESPKLPRSRYKSKIDPFLLLSLAKQELLESHSEEYKIFLLALGAGLRRDEIDTLTWKQINFEQNTIAIETTVYTAAKSAESEGEVDIDPALTEIFKGFMTVSKSEFVINSPVMPRPNAITYHHYRCARHFDRLITWLRKNGVQEIKAIHTLRKEFGSQIAAQGGIFAASLALRHSSIQLTRDTYLDKRQKVVFKVVST